MFVVGPLLCRLLSCLSHLQISQSQSSIFERYGIWMFNIQHTLAMFPSVQWLMELGGKEQKSASSWAPSLNEPSFPKVLCQV